MEALMRAAPLLLLLSLFAVGCSCKDEPSPSDDTDEPVDTDPPDDTDPQPDSDEPVEEPGADAEALDALRTASATPLRGHAEGGLLTTLELDVPLPGDPAADIVDSQLQFLEANRALYRLDDPRGELRPDRAPREGGVPVWSWRQHKQGVEVLGSSLKLVIAGDRLLLSHGRWVPDLGDAAVDLVPVVSGPDALDGVRRRGERPLALPELVLLHPSLSPVEVQAMTLAWRVTLGGQGDRSLLVDARTGATLLDLPLDLDLYADHDYQVRGLNQAGSTDRGQGTLWFTEDGQQGGYSAGLDADSEGVNADDEIRDLGDWYWDSFGRRGYHNVGGLFGAPDVQLHVDLFYTDGSGNEAMNAYGSGSAGLLQFHDGLATTDIIGHEYGHVWEFWESRLTYANQSGALSESVADVFGVLYARDHGDVDWLMGDGSAIGALRDVSNPPAFGQPDHMLAGSSGDGVGMRPVVATPSSANDNGSVHTNSGIPNKAAWLLIAGGSHNGLNVRPLGPDALGVLMYQAISGGMGSSETLSSFAADMVAMARLMESPVWDTFGFDFGYAPVSGTSCDVEKAYASVGMWTGTLDSDCDGVRDDAEWDNDADLIDDGADNCPTVSNPTQADADGDGVGDACDVDRDGDGDRNAVDNCPWRANGDQADFNSDGQGDACDDSDSDGTTDAVDNCRDVKNSSQQNTDGDGQGDACDNDDDNDGLPDASDNCPLVASPDVGDDDGDGVGDVCDNCPQDENADQQDCNGNGVGNACDPVFSLCPEDFQRLTRGLITRDSIIPIPTGCQSCPFELGVDWLERVSLPVEIAAPGDVTVEVVRRDGTVVARVQGASELEIPVGPGYQYRAPGTASYLELEGLSLRLEGTVAQDVTVGFMTR
jgi:hypothetical protein